MSRRTALHDCPVLAQHCHYVCIDLVSRDSRARSPSEAAEWACILRRSRTLRHLSNLNKAHVGSMAIVLYPFASSEKHMFRATFVRPSHNACGQVPVIPSRRFTCSHVGFCIILSTNALTFSHSNPGLLKTRLYLAKHTAR